MEFPVHLEDVVNNFSFNGNIKLKPAYAKIQMTTEQLMEYMKCEEDPVHFIRNYVKIISLDHGTVKFDMWDFQEEMVRAIVDNRFVICKMPRQVGKCCRGTTKYTVRNKITGEVTDVTAKEFHERIGTSPSASQ